MRRRAARPCSPDRTAPAVRMSDWLGQFLSSWRIRPHVPFLHLSNQFFHSVFYCELTFCPDEVDTTEVFAGSFYLEAYITNDSLVETCPSRPFELDDIAATRKWPSISIPFRFPKLWSLLARTSQSL